MKRRTGRIGRRLWATAMEGRNPFRYLIPAFVATLLAFALPGCALKQSPATGAAAGTTAATEAANTGKAAAALKPVDWRHRIPNTEFTRSGTGEWLSPDVEAEFPFDELIYSWSARLPENQGFRLYLQVGFGDSSESPWLYAGYWGTVTDPVTEQRKNPEFARGVIKMDQLLLKEKAQTYRYKVVDKGKNPLTVVPSLRVITTDNHPSPGLAANYAPRYPAVALPVTILDLPLRRQADSNGKPLPSHCQSAALASAMQYFGDKVPLEKIIPYTDDPEYNYPGIWPRTVGAGVQLGFDAYIDRFRDWAAVRETLAQNKVILCSILMPKGGNYIAPPYPSITGHIVALNGLTDDGRVIVTDSALARSGRGYRCQWVKSDFEKIWMRNKGGVGMVICPPNGAKEKVITDLPPFPANRTDKPIDFDAEL